MDADVEEIAGRRPFRRDGIPSRRKVMLKRAAQLVSTLG
jgi:hypothetical protein